MLLAFRLVWGFTGTTFSRFASFLFSPRETIAHMKGVMAGDARHHDGHNPVGAVMIFALFIGVAMTMLTPGTDAPLRSLLEAIFRVCLQIIDFAMMLAPVCVACLSFSLSWGRP